MSPEPPIDEDAVRLLAAAADLPLTQERLAQVVALMSVWLPAANHLSRTMSEPELREHMPITVFAHPFTDAAE